MAPLVPHRDATEAPLGWRWWLIESDAHGLVLRSPVTGQRWAAGTATASCLKGHPDVPRRSCSCGISAYIDFDTAADHKPLTARPTALGLVRADARVVLEPDGWRAGSIEILSVFVLGADDEYAAELGRRYGCAVLPVADLRAVGSFTVT